MGAVGEGGGEAGDMGLGMGSGTELGVGTHRGWSMADRWVRECVGVVGEGRARFGEFLEWMREQGYTDAEIYQLVLVWLEPIAPKED